MIHLLHETAKEIVTMEGVKALEVTEDFRR